MGIHGRKEAFSIQNSIEHIEDDFKVPRKSVKEILRENKKGCCFMFCILFMVAIAVPGAIYVPDMFKEKICATG